MNTANEMVLTKEQQERLAALINKDVTADNVIKHIELLNELKRLIQKRNLIFELMGEYGGTAILDYVRHDIVERIDKILKE